MPFYKNSSQHKFKKFLKKNGFVIEEGGLHSIATHKKTGTQIVYPRHNKISPGVTMELCKKLESMGFDRQLIEKKILL